MCNVKLTPCTSLALLIAGAALKTYTFIPKTLRQEHPYSSLPSTRDSHPLPLYPPGIKGCICHSESPRAYSSALCRILTPASRAGQKEPAFLGEFLAHVLLTRTALRWHLWQGLEIMIFLFLFYKHWFICTLPTSSASRELFTYQFLRVI